MFVSAVVQQEKPKPIPTRPAPRAPPHAMGGASSPPAEHPAAPSRAPVAVIPPTLVNATEPRYRNVPPSIPKRPDVLLNRPNSAEAPSRPPPPVKPDQPIKGSETAPNLSQPMKPPFPGAVSPLPSYSSVNNKSDSSFQASKNKFENASQSNNSKPEYANEPPKKALVPPGWTPGVHFKNPSKNNSPSTSAVSFQKDRVPKGASSPQDVPSDSGKPSLKPKPPVPTTKPGALKRNQSNPGAKPALPRKPPVGNL